MEVLLTLYGSDSRWSNYLVMLFKTMKGEGNAYNHSGSSFDNRKHDTTEITLDVIYNVQGKFFQMYAS